MHKLVLIRHGQSDWNLQNRFTGWKNVDLSPQGIKEAQKAGNILKKHAFHFNCLYTSALLRAQKTAQIIQEQMGTNLNPINHWKLNERHYGALTGLNKQETADKHGTEQVKIWRRSYDTPPPQMTTVAAQELVANMGDIPLCLGESLKDTVERVVPYWNEVIAPQVKKGKSIVIVAHGNSIRGLMKHLFQISNEEITKLEIPTGVPVVCELDNNLNGLEYHFLEE